MASRKNILFIMVDEKAFPFVYEDTNLQSWRSTYLTAENFLRTNCMDYLKHYTSSNACSPSRATLFTGHYPPLHGVSQTDGVAKGAIDANMPWLPKGTVPTMGNYFEEAGFKTFYKGKWHISFEDIRTPGSNSELESVVSYDVTTGEPDPYLNELYLKNDPLKDYGFRHWVGPEPFSVFPNNTGESSKTQTGGRDPIYEQEVVNMINDLRGCGEPWMMVASFVNPHDIVFYGDFAPYFPNIDFTLDPTVPAIPDPPTFGEDLSTKPTAQASYKQIYGEMLQPITNVAYYRQFYYTLQKKVNERIYNVLQAIKNSPMYEDTIIVFTSDHGDLLSSHGGLFEKWHCAYEEAIHVPLIIHNPVLFTQYHSTENLTTHVDLLPTLLSMANVDTDIIRNILSKSFTQAVPLVGKLMYCEFDNNIINYQYDTTRVNEAIYFWTTDSPSSGLNNINGLTKKQFGTVVEPNSVEAIVVYYNGSLYKYAIYFDPTNSATPLQYEMYNLTTDPIEAINLAYSTNSTTNTQAIQSELNTILLQQRSLKNIKPTLYTNPLPAVL
jgi:arylsulfatase A-like enzyme